MYVCKKPDLYLCECVRSHLPTSSPSTISSGDYSNKKMEKVIWWMRENEQGSLSYQKDEREGKAEIYI